MVIGNLTIKHYNFAASFSTKNDIISIGLMFESKDIEFAITRWFERFTDSLSTQIIAPIIIFHVVIFVIAMM